MLSLSADQLRTMLKLARENERLRCCDFVQTFVTTTDQPALEIAKALEKAEWE